MKTKTATKRDPVVPAQIKYLLGNADFLTVFQVEFIDSLRRQWKRQHRLSQKQQAVLNAIFDDIKEIKGEI